MRRSKTLSKWRQKKPAKFCALQNYIPSFLKHAAAFGYDCIWLDLEHRAFDDREVQSLLAMSHLHDIDIMVRPSTLEKSKLYRYLEDGAAGLMIPHVSSMEKAQSLVQAVKFPPLGDRGIDGAGLDCNFMVDFREQDSFDYTNWVNQETFLVVQIETPEAVESADSIASVKGVDALFIGIGDLGLRYKHMSNPNTLDEVDVIISNIAKKYGIHWGRPIRNEEDAKRALELGCQIFPFAGDFEMIMDGLKVRSEKLSQILND
jgi:4-hydroxy-2-oxoheptanedioate aldolase